MVEEIISHTLDEHRGTILIEFLYSINDINKTLIMVNYMTMYNGKIMKRILQQLHTKR